MTEKEFHAARRMVAARLGTVLIARQGNPYSHYEWLGELFGYEEAKIWIAKNTRGYILGNRIVLYVGENFGHQVVHTDEAYPLVVMAVKLHGVTQVGFGVKPGKDQPWEPKRLMDVTDYLDMAERALKMDGKKEFIEGLKIRGEVVPEGELKDHPADGVTHVETPSGEIKRVAFSAVG